MPESSSKDVEPGAEKLNTIQKNAIMVETIRKQMLRHKLHDSYMMSPNIEKNMVLTAKPTTTQNSLHTGGDSEYNDFVLKKNKIPAQKYPHPQTTTQEYFWNTHQLTTENLLNPLFHHPRRSTEITKGYRSSK